MRWFGAREPRSVWVGAPAERLSKLGGGVSRTNPGRNGVSPLILAAALCADRLASILFVSLPPSRRVACARVRARDPGWKETPPPRANARANRSGGRVGRNEWINGEFPQLDSVVNASSFFSPCRRAVCRRNELKKNNRGRQVCGAPAQPTQASARQRPTTQKARRARPIVCGEAKKTQQAPSNAATRRLNGRARGRRAAP